MKIEAKYLGDSISMKYRRKFYIVDISSQFNYILLVKKIQHHHVTGFRYITMSKNLFSVKHPTLKNLTRLSLLKLKFHVS